MRAAAERPAHGRGDLGRAHGEPPGPAVAAGRCRGRRGWRASPGLRGGRRAGHGRGGGPRPRRGTSARDRGARRPGRGGCRDRTAPRSRCCPWPIRSSASPTAMVTGAVDRIGRRPGPDPTGRAPGAAAERGRGTRRMDPRRSATRPSCWPATACRWSPCPGEPAALKVTDHADLARSSRPVARWSATRAAAGAPTAIRSDRPDGLRLGGLDIPEAPRLHGHSDGDVVAPRRCATRSWRAARPGRPGPAVPGGRPGDPRASTAGSCCARWCARLAARRARGPCRVGPDHHGRPAAPGRRDASTGCAASIAALLDLDPEAVAVKAATGNLVGRRGRRAGHRRDARSWRSVG